MKAKHEDGREFDGDENEFYRTYQPAGFVAVDEDATPDAPEATESDETAADEAEPKPKAKTAPKKAESDGK